nr:hypothetical protein [uncultured Fluviicola sp.]
MKHSRYLSNGVFLLALFALLLNDFYLKTAFPSFLSGKLSDLSGLVVFTFFFIFLLGNRFKATIFISTALLFCLWKSSLSDGFIQNWNASLPFYSIERIVDYTDLFCLIILIPVYFYQPKVNPKFNKQWIAVPVFLLSVFAISATSKGGNIREYSESYTCVVDKSFKLNMTRADFLKNIAFSNIAFEKDPNMKSPEKASDYQYYILRNFTIHDGLVVEAMYIGIREKKTHLVIDLQKMVIQNIPEGSYKEIKKRVTKETQEYFSDYII